MRFINGLVVAAGVLVTSFASEDPAQEEKTGLKVGANAPAFTLKDQAGKEVSLDDLRKGGGLVAVVFHRSASW